MFTAGGTADFIVSAVCLQRRLCMKKDLNYNSTDPADTEEFFWR